MSFKIYDKIFTVKHKEPVPIFYFSFYFISILFSVQLTESRAKQISPGAKKRLKIMIFCFKSVG